MRRALLAAGALLALAVPASAGAAERVPLSSWAPLPASPTVSPKAAALRAKLLGPRAADPRYVTLNWVGVSSFVVTIKGHLLLFDAWEILGIHKDYLPIGREELAGLEPEAILVGHGHFDHAADAGYVAGRVGSAVVASQEQCASISGDAVREGGDANRFKCAITGTQDSPAMGALSSLKLFEDLEPLTILKHIHSNPTAPQNGSKVDPFTPVTDLAPYLQHANTSPEEYARFFASADDPEGGSRLYQLRDGDFSLLLGDSAGPIFAHPKIRSALNSFPGCVDVMANAILGFDQPVSGLQDPELYVADVHPKIFLPTHGDAWAPAVSAGQAQYRTKLESELAQLPNPPEIDYLLDPQDYLRERSYRVDDPRWKPATKGSSCTSAAGPGATKQQLKISVRPRRVRLGVRYRFRFLVSSDGRPAKGAKVRFGRRSSLTDSRGRAVIRYRLTHRDRSRRPAASKAGFDSGRARLRVLRPRR